ncbi:MAG: methionine biosynthesis protein MetW, partial [Spirochaetota bacterium]
PNFAYNKLRDHYCIEGRAPMSSGILKYSWFESPNIRFFSIRDFDDLCKRLDIRITTSLAIDTESGSVVTKDPNRFADLALYVLEKRH